VLQQLSQAMQSDLERLLRRVAFVRPQRVKRAGDRSGAVAGGYDEFQQGNRLFQRLARERHGYVLDDQRKATERVDLYRPGPVFEYLRVLIGQDAQQPYALACVVRLDTRLKRLGKHERRRSYVARPAHEPAPRT